MSKTEVEITPSAGYIAKSRECDWRAEQILILTQQILELKAKLESQSAELDKLRPDPATKDARSRKK